MIITEYFNLVLLFGAAMSFLMAMFLWFSPPFYFSNRVLGTLMFVWTFTITSFSIQSGEFFVRFPHLFGISSSFAYLFFPLMYMYIKSYLYKDARQIKQYLLHLIPFVLFILIISPFYFQSAEVKSTFIKNGFPDWINIVFNYGSIIVVLQGILYTILSIRTLQHFQYFRKKRLSSKQAYSVRWIMQFVVINVVLWAIGTIGAIMGMLDIITPIDPFKIYYLGITLLTLRLGYFTINNPFSFSTEEKNILRSSISNDKKSKSLGTSIDRNDLKIIITFINTQKPYLKKDMNLHNLVEGTGFSKHRISELLNNELGKSFYDVINEYRVNEAIKLLDEGKHKDYTLEHIAEKSGFNSKATFYRIFKKNTGKTPNKYIQSKE